MQSYPIDRSVPVLPPHPRWRWAAYPARWLIGGCWGLLGSPLSALLYGSVFFVVGLTWTLALSDPDTGRLAQACALTLMTLLLCPRLTASLTFGRPTALASPRGLGSSAPVRPLEHDAQPGPGAGARQGALLAVGGFLLLILAIGLSAAKLGFVLLYSPEAVPPQGLLGDVFSWRNAPLVLVLALILSLTVLAMQALGSTATYALRDLDTDLPGALRASALVARANARPLAWWALSSQAILIVGGALMPLALVVLAPTIAHGTWWAFRETTLGVGPATQGIDAVTRDR